MRGKRGEGLNQKENGERKRKSRERYAALNGHEALTLDLLENACRKMPIMTPVGGQKRKCQQRSKERRGALDKRGSFGHTMNGGKWLICADGEWPPEPIWRPLVEQADVIIACDGAFQQCLDRTVQPNIVIGDMDSVEEARFGQDNESVQWVRIEEQENSDLSKAIEHAAQHAPKNLDVIGVEGGALGHIVAPFFALYDAPPSTVIHINESRIMCVKNASLAFTSIEIGSMVSLFAIGRASGVTLTGCEWPLNQERLEPGTRGLNNRSINPTVEINVDDGAVLVCIEPAHNGPLGK